MFIFDLNASFHLTVTSILSLIIIFLYIMHNPVIVITYWDQLLCIVE